MLGILAVLGWPSAPVRAAPPALQTIRIDVRGAVAHVRVSRATSCPRGGPEGDGDGAAAFRDASLDVALPARAQLLDVSVVAGGRVLPTKVVPFEQARDAYLDWLRGSGITPAAIPFEDEARFRIRTACSSPSANKNKNLELEYTFSVLLELAGDRVRLVFPAAAELSPPPTRVEVHAPATEGLADITIAGASHPMPPAGAPIATETVSTRSPWVVSWGPIRGPVEQRGERARLAVLTAMTNVRRGKGPLLAYAIGASAAPRQALPERVLFLVDRSRSVGPGGLEAERDVARRVLQAMPPSTHFDALFFDRGQKRLFPLARGATREAIASLDDEMVPVRMANGTDLPAVMRAAGELLRREASDFSPRCLLVLLTDGAVGAPARGTELSALLKPPPNVDLMIAAVTVRLNDDREVSAPERSVLRGLTGAATLGGVERTMRAADIPDAVPAFLEALRAGGDVVSIGIGPGAAPSVAEVLEPGAGVSDVVTRGPARPILTHRGLPRPLPLRPAIVDADWLEPWATTTRTPVGRLSIAGGIAVLVEPVAPVEPAPRPGSAASANPSGFMERSVVRDTLSLAFTPRARACYLNRSARTAAERDLAGRVRLALDLVRGEVASVRIEASTLAHPTIESCLREAAYAIEVPRAYRNDDPVTAILNLVFRPRTPDLRAAGGEKSDIGREIDMLVDAALKSDVGAVDSEAVGPAPVPAPPVSPMAPDAGARDAGRGGI